MAISILLLLLIYNGETVFLPDERNIFSSIGVTISKNVHLHERAVSEKCPQRNAFAEKGFWKYIERSSSTMSTVLTISDGKELAYNDIGWIPRKSWEFNRKVSTFHYQNNFVDLKYIIGQISGESSDVLLLMLVSTETFTEILQKVRQQYVTSQKLQWIFLTTKNRTKYLSSTFSKLHKIRLLQEESNEGYSFSDFGFRNSPSEESGFEMKLLAKWTRDESCLGDYFNLTIFPTSRQLNFNQHEMRIPTVDNLTYMNPLRRGIDAIDDRILGNLAEVFNFRFHVVYPIDFTWGGPQPDGNITGIIGMVAREEADFSLEQITITGSRARFVDFSYPYYFEPVVLITKAPHPVSSSWAVFTPFSLAVWMIVILSVLFYGSLLWFSIRFLTLNEDHDDTFSLINSFMLSIQYITVKGGIPLEVNSWSLRFVLVFYSLLGIVIYALYSGILTAVIVTPTYQNPIDSFGDLLQHASENNYTLITRKGTMLEYLFQTATDGIYKKVFDFFNQKGRFHSYYVEYPFFEMVLTGSYANMASKLQSEIEISKRNKELFYISRETFSPQSYGVTFPHGSSYVEEFSRHLQILVETGIIAKWEADEVWKVTFIGFFTTNSSKKADSGRESFSLAQMQGAFYLYFIGMAMASFALAFEWLYVKIQ